VKLFGKLLHEGRESLGLTQEKFIRELSGYDLAFRKLNTVTLSRWERGVSLPPLSKQKKLLRFLWSASLFDEKTFRQMYIARLEQRVASWKTELKNFSEGVIGNFPVFDLDRETYECRHNVFLGSHEIERIVLIEKAIAPPGYYAVSAEQLSHWLSHDGTVLFICRLKEFYLGHVVLLKLSPEWITHVMQGKRSEFDIDDHSLRRSDEHGIYLIHAFYGVNAEYPALMSTKILITLIENRSSLGGISVFGTSAEAK
jgi:transcriptional regulator with XRE-family HTH domain